MTRLLVGLILATCILAIGTGTAEYLHDLDHDREDAAEARIAKASGLPDKPHPIHDETNCRTHAALHALAIAGGWVPVLIALGLFVAFLTQLATTLRSQHPTWSIDCRGPPVCA